MGFFKRKEPSGTPLPAPAGSPLPPPPPGVAQGFDPEQMRLQAEQIAADFRKPGRGRASIADLTKFAMNAQAQAQQQMQAAQQAQQSGGGVGAIMAALGMNYSSDYVKRVDCPSCGGPKQLPSATAYIYCDYCGALADFDFRRACEDATMPGPAYMQLVNGSQGELKAAKAAGDIDHYRAVQLRIFDAYVANCPKACSHRVGDPAYRDQLVRYLAETSVLNDFDPQFAAIAEEMIASVRAIPWTGSLMARRTGGPAFRELVDVCQRQVARSNDIASAHRMTDVDPDHASQAVRDRMFHSLFAQGWLPMLEQQEAVWLIAELKLAGEYTKIQPVTGESRHCAGCGGDVIAVLAGARTVVCDHCGRSIDVGGAQSPCGGCGAHLSFPMGVQRMPCPYCKVETGRIGWT